MAVAFTPGQVLGRGDLDIHLTNDQNNPTNAYSISFALFYVSVGPPEEEVAIGGSMSPQNPAVGEYYAAVMVPEDAPVGTYRIRWTLQELNGDPFYTVVQEFAVVQTGTVVASSYTATEQALMSSLRRLLRDNNPDKYYHFRPPEHEGTVGAYNRVFGQVWEDADLYEYIISGLDWINMLPPNTQGSFPTPDALIQKQRSWRTMLMWAAAKHAMYALMVLWTQEEFDYSIGGISLSIEKSSKFDALARIADEQVKDAAEAKRQTTFYIRGLQQPRFGMGVRSAFGPHTGSGILSPRNFI